MSIRLACADDVPPQAWRNGGGRTRELLAWPSIVDWTLRISLADIDADGPFSAFDGVQRWFTVIEGGGVALAFADGERRLSLGDAPLCFDGASAPGCRLLNGPTRDLNLMARGGNGMMKALSNAQAWTHTAPQRGLFCATAGVWRCGDGRRCRLAARTLLWMDDAAGLEFSFDTDNDIRTGGWWLSFDPQGAKT